MKLLLLILTITSVNATCLQDSELETINMLSPDQASEYMINKAELLNDETCGDIAEGIDFEALKESIQGE